MSEEPSQPSRQDQKWGTYAPCGWRGLWLRLCQAIPSRRLAIWCRSPLKKKLGEWVDVRVWGLKLRVSACGNLSEQRLIFTPKHLDPREREVLYKIMSGGGVFLDIGANAGVYSLWLASRKIVNLQVEAFEPDPDLCQRLGWNIRENGIKNLNLNQCALGRAAGEMILLRGEVNLGQNEVVPSGEGLAIEVKTLAGFLQENHINRVKAMKIDIEGHEREVLEPFFESTQITAWPEIVICETLDNGVQADGAKVLLAAGYELLERTRMNGIFRLASPKK